MIANDIISNHIPEVDTSRQVNTDTRGLCLPSAGAIDEHAWIETPQWRWCRKCGAYQKRGLPNDAWSLPVEAECSGPPPAYHISKGRPDQQADHRNSFGMPGYHREWDPAGNR